MQICFQHSSFFFKLGIAFPFWRVLYILSGTRLQTDIWKTFFCKAFFCLCMRKRCPFCLCAGGIQPGWCFPGSQDALIEDQAMECILLQCCFWSEAGLPLNCLYCAGCRRVDCLAAYCFSCSRQMLEKRSWKRVAKLHKILLTGINLFTLEIVHHFLWNTDKWPRLREVEKVKFFSLQSNHRLWGI